MLDVRGQESEAYYTINEQPMVANVEGMQVNVMSPAAKRFGINNVSATDEEALKHQFV